MRKLRNDQPKCCCKSFFLRKSEREIIMDQASRTHCRCVKARRGLIRHLPRKAAAPINIQFIRFPHLYGLEVGKATRLLEGIIADHKCSSVRQNACLLLNGIKGGREIFDQYPLISEWGKRKQSPPIYIHDDIFSEIASATKSDSRTIGGRDY